MKKVLLVLSLALLCAFIAPDYGFSQYQRTLSLRDAIALARSNNSEIVIARFDLLKAKERVSEVYSENLVPTITLNSRYNRAFKKQVFDIFGEKLEIGSDNQITNTIDVTQSIPGLGTPIFNGVRIAEYYERLSAENINSVQSRVETDVKKAYYGVLLAKEVMQVNEERLRNSTNNFQVVEARYRNGAATEFEYLRSRVNIETIRPAIEKSEADFELSRQFLRNAIGIKTNETIDVQGVLSYDSAEVFGTTDAVIARIAENNVAVRQLRITNLINRELVEVNEANYLPKLYLFGQYSLSAGENDDRAISDYRFYNTLNAGIGLSWDLNIFKNEFRVNQSEIEVRKTEEQILNLKQVLTTQAESIITRIEDAKNRIRSQRETVALAERSVQLANVSFQNGVLRQIDVLDAELILTQSRFGYLQAIYDYQVAKAELEGLLNN